MTFSEHPKWNFIKPDQLRESYLNGTIEMFDIIFTYSSVEHSGLGIKVTQACLSAAKAVSYLVLDHFKSLRALTIIVSVLQLLIWMVCWL